MKSLISMIAGAALMAAPVFSSPLPAASEIDVAVLGEIHDSPEHHAVQADAIEALAPTAVVFEMLTPGEAAALSGVPRTAEAMTDATAGFHWNNIADYAEVLAASQRIIGAAAPRDAVREAFDEGAAEVLGEGADIFRLSDPLPADQQALRENLQFEAHCDAMPRNLMAGMVEAQRYRDAVFAQAVLDAFDTHGGPVVLVTGNGHARTDWGVPFMLSQARPGLRVVSLGQGEAGVAPEGRFDVTLTDAATPDRPDPCQAFR